MSMFEPIRRLKINVFLMGPSVKSSTKKWLADYLVLLLGSVEMKPTNKQKLLNKSAQ